MAHWRGEILSSKGKESSGHLCRTEAPYARDWVCEAGGVGKDIEEHMDDAVEDWPDAVDYLGGDPLYEVIAEGAMYRIVACACPDNV